MRLCGAHIHANASDPTQPNRSVKWVLLDDLAKSKLMAIHSLAYTPLQRAAHTLIVHINIQNVVQSLVEQINQNKESQKCARAHARV